MRKINTGSKKIKTGTIKQIVPKNFKLALIEQEKNRKIQTCIDNLGVLHLKAVVYGLIETYKFFYKKLNFHCIKKYEIMMKKSLNFSEKLINEINKRELEFDQHFMAVEFHKLFSIEEKIEKEKGSRINSINRRGVFADTLSFFGYIHHTAEILEKLLIINFYRKQETTYAKYIRTYCKQLYDFFIDELNSEKEVSA